MPPSGGGRGGTVSLMRFGRLLALGALLAAAALTSACVPDPCNGECAEGEVCDETRLKCVPDTSDGGTDGGPTGCSSDSHCPQGRRCLVSRSECVECLAATDCLSGRCDTATNTCLAGGCNSDADCEGDKPYCGPEGACVECRTASDCLPANGQRRTCDLFQRRCVANPCTRDTDCILDATGKVCETDTGMCVACLRDDQCPNGAATRRCDPEAKRCVACLETADCAEELGETCAADQTCKVTGCAGDASCTGPQRCSPDTRECVGCLDDADCPLGGTCADGACAQAASCAEDADCFWPARCSNAACVACLTEADCRAGQSCTAGVCTEPASCTDTAECGPGRVCSSSACVAAPSCTADAFEPNDAPATAAPINPGEFDARLCPNEVDHYALRFQADAGARVSVTYDAALPAPKLRLVAGDGRGVPAEVVEGTVVANGHVRATLERAGASASGLLVQVENPTATPVPYHLSSTVSSLALCDDDGGEPDDAQSQAKPVGTGVFTGILCPKPSAVTTQDDWFVIDVPEGNRPVATLKLERTSAAGGPPPNFSAVVQIYLYVNGSLVLDGSTHWVFDPARPTVLPQAAPGRVATAGGTRYWVKLANASYEKLKYELSLDVRPKPPANDRCANATRLEPGVVGEGSTRGAVSEGDPACGGGAGADAFWSLKLTQPSRVRLSLTAEFDAVLSLESSCDEPVVLGCDEVEAGGESLSFDALPAGDYRVRVDGLAAQQGAYTLFAEVLPAAPPPAGETCALAGTLDLSTGSATETGNLARSVDDLATCGAAGGDAFYAFELAEPKRVRAVLTGFPGASVSLVSEASCADGTGAACAAAKPRGAASIAELDRAAVPAGRHVLVVDGGTAAEGDFTLAVELLEPIFPPANDACGGAEELTGTATGDTRGAEGDVAPSCGATGHAAGDVVYLVRLAEDSQLDLALAADFDAALTVTDACDGGQVLACADGADARVRLAALAAGDYWVWVDGWDDEAGTFTLTETRSPAPPVPGNDTCEAAEAVDLSGGPVELQTNTARATDAVHPAACAPTGQPLRLAGPDVAWAVTVPAGAKLSASLVSADFDAALYVLAGCDASTCVAGEDAFTGLESISAVNTGTSAASWVVVLDSWRAATSGAATVRLALE